MRATGRPQPQPGGDDRFLAVLNDSSFLLKAREGLTVAFDPAGRFTHATQLTLGRISQVPYEVRFNYELASRGFRVAEAQVFDRSKNQPIYHVGYSYGQDGDLLRTLVSPATAIGAPR